MRNALKFGFLLVLFIGILLVGIFGYGTYVLKNVPDKPVSGKVEPAEETPEPADDGNSAPLVRVKAIETGMRAFSCAEIDYASDGHTCRILFCVSDGHGRPAMTTLWCKEVQDK